jgi:hypothetical protein
MILETLERQEVPSTAEEYDEYCQSIRDQINKKYSNLIKNAHQYLCYMHLLNYNYVKCIDHGSKLLDIEGIAQ